MTSVAAEVFPFNSFGRRLFLAAFMGFIITVPGQAAVVYLRDGSRIEGTVVGATALEIEVYTSNGPVQVQTSRLLRIDYAGGEAPAPYPAPQPGYGAPAPSPVMGRPKDLGRQVFSMELGMAAPLSNVDFSAAGGGSDSNGNPGILLGTQYTYSLDPHLGTGISLEYFNRSGTLSSNLVPNAGTSVYGDSLLFLGILKYSLVAEGDTKPFIMAGAGAHRTSTRIDAMPDLGFSWSDNLRGPLDRPRRSDPKTTKKSLRTADAKRPSVYL